MKEHPINFNKDEIKAILDGRKTMFVYEFKVVTE